MSQQPSIRRRLFTSEDSNPDEILDQLREQKKQLISDFEQRYEILGEIRRDKVSSKPVLRKYVKSEQNSQKLEQSDLVLEKHSSEKDGATKRPL